MTEKTFLALCVRWKIFSSCDLLFSFRLLRSESVSFISSGPKCLKVSQNGSFCLSLSHFVSLFSIFLLEYEKKNRKLIPFNADTQTMKRQACGYTNKKLSRGIVSKFNILCFKDVNVFLKFTISILYMV